MSQISFRFASKSKRSDSISIDRKERIVFSCVEYILSADHAVLEFKPLGLLLHVEVAIAEMTTD